MAKKHLDGTGNGEFVYDLKTDILMAKICNRDYKMSVEFQNFIADVDTEGFVTGIRIFDASDVFGIDKHTLQNISKLDFKTTIKDGLMTVRLSFVGKAKNKDRPPEQFTQQLTTTLNGYKLQDAIVECAMA